MNDNLKEAFKELENLDVCPEGKETIKKIFCKALGEKYENGKEIKEFVALKIYESVSNNSTDEKPEYMIKVNPHTNYIFIAHNGFVSEIGIHEHPEKWIAQELKVKEIVIDKVEITKK